MTVDGAPAFKAASQVTAQQELVVSAPPRTFVSRGGEKLAHALDVFDLEVAGIHALDAGASTGGFTDCLLQRGAQRVLAVDVGYGQLHHRLRQDPRVVVLERTNVRDLTAEQLPPPSATLVVADLSFISLALVLPSLRRVAAEEAAAVLLVKPQFESARDDVGDGGIVRDPTVWRSALLQVVGAAEAQGWGTVGVATSPLLGAKGNVEFLVHLTDGPVCEDVAERIEAAVADGRERRRGPAPTGGRS